MTTFEWDSDGTGIGISEIDPIDHTRTSAHARRAVIAEAIEFLQSTPAVLLAGKGGGYELPRERAGLE